MNKLLKRSISFSFLVSIFSGNVYATETVTIAYQTGLDPSKVAQATGEYEKATNTNINWRKFESGADVLAAIASGNVALGNLGSSPLAAAASRGLPVQVFLVSGVIGDSEALVVKDNSNIRRPQDLIGKKIAVPFVSTTHYSLLAALRHWKINPNEVKIVNLRPSEITAAWQRGDIDGAYVWEPALGQIKITGKVLTSSSDVGKWGAPTYDLWIVRKDFAEKNPNFLKKFAEVTTNAFDRYNKNPKNFVETKANIEKISKLTGSKPEDVVLLLSGNKYLSLKDQNLLLQKPFIKSIADTAAFLKDQGKIDKLQDNYAPFVTNKYVTTSK